MYQLMEGNINILHVMFPLSMCQLYIVYPKNYTLKMITVSAKIALVFISEIL